MVFRRSFACLLAAVLVITALPASSSSHTALAAPADPNRKDIKLSYIESDESDPKVATIVRGSSTGILIEKGSGFTASNPPFTVTSVEGGVTDPEKYITVKDTTSADKKDITASVDLPINEVGKATFAIEGNYYAILAEGDAYESAPGWGANQLTRVEATTSGAVLEYSELILKCTKAETKGTRPEFEVVAGPTGSFAGYDQVSVRSCTQWSAEGVAASPKEKELTVQLAGGGKTKDLKIVPKQIHTIQKKDESGNLVYDAAGNPVIAETNNYIAKDSTFRLVFRLPTSNQLFLNVLTPKQATRNVADEVFRNDGVNNQSYIKLTEGDQLNFITKGFTLNSYIQQYSTDFNIEWKWIPTEDNEANRQVVIIASSGTWRNVVINPAKDDVTGSLVATVYHRKGQRPDSGVSEGEVIAVSKPIDILIRGVGEPGTVNQYSETIGKNPVYVFPEAERPLPSSKNMDVYNGEVENYKEPNKPYRYVLDINMGRLNAAAEYAIVEVVDEGKNVLSAQTIVGTAADNYTFGQQIANPTKNNPELNGRVQLAITAQNVGPAKLQVVYYIKGSNGAIIKSPVQPKPITINVSDSSPSDDSSLKELILRTKENIDFGFSPSTNVYNIDVPYSTDKFTVAPTRNHPQAVRTIKLKYTTPGADGNPVVVEQDLESGFTSKQFDLVENMSNKMEITVTAQNPNVSTTYTLNIMRLPPSRDGTVKTMQILDANGKDWMVGFKPNVMDYQVSVPYRCTDVQFVWETNHPNTQKPNFNYTLKPIGGTPNWLGIPYPSYDKPVSMEVVPENNVKSDGSTYTFDIVRQPPNKDASLKDIKITDTADKAITYKPTFNAAEEVYELSIPYSTAKLKFSATSTYEWATLTLMRGLSKVTDMPNGRFTQGIDIHYTTQMNPVDELTIVVLAEDGATRKEYKLRITREAPENDATLETLKIFDQNKVDLKLPFHPEILNYDLTVPYAVDKVTVVPASASKFAQISVNGRTVESGKDSIPIKLENSRTQITVVVTAQDGTTKRTYQIWITKAPPSSDARLKSLTLTGADGFKPLFLASRYVYSANITQGAKGVVITATANDPYAKIYVDGVEVESGKPSHLVETLTINQRVEVRVVAQDGVTPLSYYIDLTNQNLIEKTNNADLSNLQVNVGTMDPPRFQPSVTTYDVAVSEETSSVRIIPTPADKLAKVEVFQGSKLIGDQHDNYAEYIEEGETEFSVKVTAPDGSRSKEYLILVHRNEEDKQGRMQMITLEDVNFTPDVIPVDITKYQRVSAEVFNELKKYPDKKMILQGNDYSFEFKGADIINNIPNTIVYDFSLSFVSPFEEKIMDEIDSSSYNDDLNPVYIHFRGDGALPAKGIFSLTLGRRYWEDQFFWHYYNEERERIDYYGYMSTNNRGTFSVPIEHMSTYIVTRGHAIRGSDNKSNPDGGDINTTQGPKLDQPIIIGKDNPNTGRGGRG